MSFDALNLIHNLNSNNLVIFSICGFHIVLHEQNMKIIILYFFIF